MTEQKSGLERGETKTTPLTEAIIRNQETDYGKIVKEIFDAKIERPRQVRVLRGWYDDSKMPGVKLTLGLEPHPEKPEEQMRVTYMDTAK